MGSDLRSESIEKYHEPKPDTPQTSKEENLVRSSEAEKPNIFIQEFWSELLLSIADRIYIIKGPSLNLPKNCSCEHNNPGNNGKKII
jgi:hypothetical protein